MIGIVDYGVGNLFSLLCSFRRAGVEVFVSSDKDELMKADKLVLPGVGAFRDAKERLDASGLGEFVKDAVARGVPLLGICLGMLLLFDKSYEYGEHWGLGILKGTVAPLSGDIPEELRIPHIGWNALSLCKSSPIFKYLSEGDYVYFVHSYHVVGCEDSLCATTEYGKNITAAVNVGDVYGCQFHPEKSGEVGLSILKAFSEL